MSSFSEIPYVELAALDGAEKLVPVHTLRFRYIPEVGAAIAETQVQAEAVGEGKRHVFVDLKRWTAHLEVLNGRARALAARSEAYKRRTVQLVEEAGNAVFELRETACRLEKASAHLPRSRVLVDRIMKSSDDLIGLFGALRLAERSEESGFGEVP